MNYTESQKKFEQSFVSDINQENQKFIHVPLMILKLESMYHEVDVIETLGKISNITKEIKETTTAFDHESTCHQVFEIPLEDHNEASSWLHQLG